MFKILFSGKFSGLLFCAGLFCVAAYRIIGTTVDDEGFLHEPFALIPMGWFFLISGVIIACLYFIRVKKTKT